MNVLRRPALLLLLFSGLSAYSQSPRQEAYSWENVQIVGGGFVDGIVFHPSTLNVRYARTDMGGAYRWDATAHRWHPILDWVPYKDLNLMGVESIAVDPADPERLYMACGTYTNQRTPNGAILRSTDRGQTFQRTDVPFKFGGNEDGRGNGERLAVDPNDGRLLYLGTRHDGLWRSQDRGASWSQVVSFPDVSEIVPPAPVPLPGETPEQHWHRMPVRSSGIIFVKFETSAPTQVANSATQTIYVGVSLMNRPNLFVSNDGGTTWSQVPGEPTEFRPTRAALSTDGFLYITYGTAPGPSHMKSGAVWKLDTHSGTWTDITPDPPVAGVKEFGYAAVSVDAQHPRTLIASSFGRPGSAGGDDIFRSTDGGASWKAVFGAGGVYDYGAAPYVKKTPIHWLFDIEIDPANPDHAVFTTGYGGWETFDLTNIDRGTPTHWSILSTGIEQTVALDLLSPVEGAHLITGVGDYGGFVHWNLDSPEAKGSSEPPRLGNTTGIASAALRPEVVVRVGANAEHKPGNNISYSLDAGRTWKPTATSPTAESRLGSIASSADGRAWVWTPDREPAYVTHDLGATWTAVQGLPAGLRVIADPTDPRSFYAISLADRILYSSSDGAATFTARNFTLPDAPTIEASSSRGDTRGGQDRIYLTPDRAADLWLASFDGLYRMLPLTPQITDSHASFVRLPAVEQIQAFGFGKAALNHNYPTLYLVGTVAGQPGIFRSTDKAQSWVRINDDAHQWGLILQITGDPRLYGRVYVGTHGRGVFYGDSSLPTKEQARAR